MTTNAVYFSSMKINTSEYAVPSKAGWWEGRKLRHIHSFRPKPDDTGGDSIRYQPEILSERSNDVLKDLANGKLNVEAKFIQGVNTIKTTTEIVSNSRDLQSVDFESTKTRWEWFEDCFSFFYPGNRVYTAQTGIVGYEDTQDETRGEGWYGRQNIALTQPYQIAKILDHLLLAQRHNEREGKEVHQESKQRAEEFFDKFKAAGIALNLKYLGNLNWSFLVKKTRFDDLSFSMRETVSLALDFYLRLVAIRKSFDASAICLIENHTALNSEILTALFPNVQFIVD